MSASYPAPDLLHSAAVASLLLSGFSTVSAASFAKDADPKIYQLSKVEDGDWKLFTVTTFDGDNIATSSARRLAPFKRRSLKSPYSYPPPQKAQEPGMGHS